MTPSTPVLSPAAAPVPPPGPPLSTIVINGEVRMPGNFPDLDAFRQWLRSEQCPEKVRFSWINGIIYIETRMEQMYTHNRVKGEFTRALGTLERQINIGLYLTDGMQLSNANVNLSTVPDGLFVSYAALRTGRVRRLPSVRHAGAVELEGSPEMVLEVVSHSSEEKDFTVLQQTYHLAHVDEFWRIDVRGDLLFEILRWTASGYVSARLPDGWWHSDLFARDFLLVQDTDSLGDPRYTLQVRP